MTDRKLSILWAQFFHRTTALVVLGLVNAGCSQFRPLQQSLIPDYKPANVYAAESVLPVDLKRVALLPISATPVNSELEFAEATVWPVLLESLHRAKLFEVVQLSKDQVTQITGARQWDSKQPFSQSFFESLRDRLDVQAVMIGELTAYSPYEPLVLGWRLKLIDTIEPRVLWALDEVFDCRTPQVAISAQRHSARQQIDSHSAPPILQSPRLFANYTTSLIVTTIPPRANQLSGR